MKKTKEWVQEQAKKIINKSIGELDKFNRNINNKGYVGHVIEQSVYGINPNSKKTADIEEANIEIKTLPLKKSKKESKYLPKERLVLCIINYINEHFSNIYDSLLYKKNKNIQLIFYYNDENIPKNKYKVVGEMFIHFDDLPELEQIKKDWEIITTKINNGKAHLISERDTLYLSAATKGQNAKKSLRKQLNIKQEKAKQRCFSLKQSYLRLLLAQNMEKLSWITDKPYLNNITEFKNKILEYKNIPLKTLFEKYNLENKAINSKVIKTILNVKSFLEIPVVTQESLMIRTIDLHGKKIPPQHIPICDISPNDFTDISWEESDFYDKLATFNWFFIIINLNNNKEKVISEIIIWSPNEEELMEAQTVWEDTKNKFLNGIKLEPIQQKNRIQIKNDLISSTQNQIYHIRPRGRNGEDTYKIPSNQHIVKQRFWVNNKYFLKIKK